MLTSAGQSVQIEVEDRWFKALVQIRNVLGPVEFGCGSTLCEGCEAEGVEALRIANVALGFVTEKSPDA